VPSNLLPLSDVRGTILALDWRAFRTLEIYDAYVGALHAERREALLAVTAGSWVPLELLLVHYDALDSLALDPKSIRRVGWEVGNGVHGAFLSMLVRLMGKLGATPWLALEQAHKLWVRSWQGGGIAVHVVEDKVADVTILEAAVCASHFFRTSFAGALEAGIAPFCSAHTADELAGSRTEMSVTFRVGWEN
jgi:hypothetical protein